MTRGKEDDPLETPLPRSYSDPHTAAAPSGDEHRCLHLELIDDVRQQRKERPAKTARLWGLSVTILIFIAGSIGGLATCVYTQGQSSGADTVRLEALEDGVRAGAVRDDRLEARQREDLTQIVQQQTKILEALHAIDSRTVRIEEQLKRR